LSRHFTISTVGEVQFEGIAFWNGGDTIGSAVFASIGRVTFIDCEFRGNIATDYGAVEAPASLKLLRTSFVQNRAARASAVHASSAQVLIEECTFESNEANEQGVVMFEKGEYQSSLLIKTSTFKNNSAKYGSSITVEESGLNVTVVDSTFKENTATEHTSGIYITGDSSLAVSNTVFRNNIGAGITVQNRATFVASDISVIENTLLETEIGIISATEASNIVISECQFNLNLAASVGIQNCEAAIYSSLFSLNVKTSLFISEATVLVSNATFLKNSADQGAGLQIVSTSSVVVQGSKFVENIAENGGAVYLLDSGIQLVENSFFNNLANTHGGSIFIEQTDATDEQQKVLSLNNFEKDSATSGGSIYIFRAANIIASQNQFSRCHAKEDGGGWYLDEASANVTDLEITGCQSKSDGGAITAVSESILRMESVFFTNCSSDIGGALSVKSQSVLIVMTGMFSQNRASDAGGALAVQEESVVELFGVNFENNYAKQDGGAIYLVRLDLTENGPFVDGATFSNNTAEILGGSIYLALCDGIKMKNMVTWYSKAEAGGDVSSLAAELTIMDSFFYKCTTSQGGLYLLHSEFQMFNSYLSDSHALENGGLIYAFASNILVSDSWLTDGSTGSNGGGLFVFDSPSHFYRSNFTNNYAAEFGGGLFATGTTLVVLDQCIFKNNYGGSGGAVHFQESEELRVHNCTFESNRADKEAAGMLCEESETVFISDSVYEENLVTGSYSTDLYGGGALKLYIVFHADIMGTKFLYNGGYNNSNFHDGGAIYIAYCGVAIRNCHFEGNTAANGGAVYFGPEPVQTSTTRKLPSRAHGAHHLHLSRFGVKERLFGLSRPKYSSSGKVSAAEGTGKRLLNVIHGQQTFDPSNSVSLSGSTFVNNQADSGGGALSYEENEPFGIDGNNFANNSALYGGAFTSPPSYIVAIHSGNSEESGYEVSHIDVQLRDQYDEIVRSTNDGDVFCSISETDDSGATVSGQVSATFRQGVATFTGLIVEKIPDSYVNISFSTAIVTGTSSLELYFQPCKVGEVLPDSTGTCLYCGFGSFSVDPTDTYCHDCPDGAVCYGGSDISPYEGFWRFPNSTGVCHSNVHDECELHECFVPEACLGDIEISDSAVFNQANKKELFLPVGANAIIKLQKYCWDANSNYNDCELYIEGYQISIKDSSDAILEDESGYGTLTLSDESAALVKSLAEDRTASYSLHLKQKEECSTGYIGNVCARCDAGYSSGGGYACWKCYNLAVSYCILILGILAIIAIGSLMVWLQMNKDNSRNEKISILMKIFTSYLQLISLFSALEMDWPSTVTELFDKAEIVSKAGDRIITIECIFNQAKGGSSDYDPADEEATSMFYRKLAFFMAAPVMAVVGAATFWSLTYLKKKVHFMVYRWDKKVTNSKRLKPPGAEEDEPPEEITVYEQRGLWDVLDDGMIEQHEVGETLEKMGENHSTLRVNTIITILDMEKKGACHYSQFQSAYLSAYKQIVVEDFILSVVVLLFMVHPNVAHYTFLVFTCKELETDKFFLQEDLDTACYTPEHYWWQFACGLPFMAAYTAGIPAVAFLLLRRHRHNLDCKHVKLKYGFLYDGYEKNYYFWEMWVMLRKVAVVTITVFLAKYGEMSEALAGLCVTVFAMIVHLKCQPYEDEELDRLESGSLYATVITLICGLFFYSNEINHVAAEMFFVGVICLANALFFGFFAYAAIREYKKKLVTMAINYYQGKIEKKHKHNMGLAGDKKYFWRKPDQDKKKAFDDVKGRIAKLDEMYRERASLQEKVMMIKLETEAAKKRLQSVRDEYLDAVDELEQYELQMKRVLESEDKMAAEIDGFIPISPSAYKDHNKKGLVWDHFDDVKRCLALETMKERLSEDKKGKNSAGDHLILNLYQKTCPTSLIPSSNPTSAQSQSKSERHGTPSLTPIPDQKHARDDVYESKSERHGTPSLTPIPDQKHARDDVYESKSERHGTPSLTPIPDQKHARDDVYESITFKEESSTANIEHDESLMSQEAGHSPCEIIDALLRQIPPSSEFPNTAVYPEDDESWMEESKDGPEMIPNNGAISGDGKSEDHTAVLIPQYDAAFEDSHISL